MGGIGVDGAKDVDVGYYVGIDDPRILVVLTTLARQTHVEV